MLPNPTPYPQFRFVRFNPVRAQRGKEAAEVEVMFSVAEDERGRLWMSEADIRANILQYGEHAQLKLALAAYGSRKK